ncbi:hypothetical protein [Enterobacter phage 02_vB_Eclo_IJM]|nr:hypothetical protein [Enterobacter phage 02_vB_Eclo_IJM]
MLPYQLTRGRHMCACRLWEDGQSNFKSFEDFKAHTYRMADEFDGEEYTIYDVSGSPVAYLYMLATTLAPTDSRSGPFNCRYSS